MLAKYIMVGDMNVPIVFPEFMDHSKVAENFGGPEKVSSAGFVKVGVDGKGGIRVVCWGESTTLGLKSGGEEDAVFIKIMLRGKE